MTQPAFTVVELEIAELAGRGFGHARIAMIRRCSPKTIEKAVDRIAGKLENPDELPPLTLVQLWAAHRIWLRQFQQAA